MTPPSSKLPTTRTRSSVPAPVIPTRPAPTGGPLKTWPHRPLYDRVIDALHALPRRFKTSMVVGGIAATDLFTLNTPLGASIEQSVVDNLNELREIWDPNNAYELYSFVRQPQTFPDVRLQTTAPNQPTQIILGIELKGWFALAKEAEPSFRYKAAPAVCAEQDLLVVFPWALDEVISGRPHLLKPFIAEAKHAALYRNYYWEHMRGATGNARLIQPAPHQAPYPKKGEKYNDTPASDSGKNFGRAARGGYMSNFINEVMRQPLSGIPIGAWQKFIEIFSDGVSEGQVSSELKKIEVEYLKEVADQSAAQEAFSTFADSLKAMVSLLKPNP